MRKLAQNKYDNFKVIEKRLELLVGAKLRKNDKISEAIEKLHELREKLTSKVGSFNGVAEIRKWRKTGCT
jgi:hypothetical protein